MTRRRIITKYDKGWLKDDLQYRRQILRVGDRRYINWICSVVLHHEWLDNSTDYLYVCITDRLFHQGLIHAVNGKSISTYILLSDMFGICPITEGANKGKYTKG